MRTSKRFLVCSSLLALAAIVNGCGGGGGGSTSSAPAGPKYTVGGTVTGVSVGGLKLTLNGGNEITVDATGSFTFTTPLPDGSSYDVRVSQNPTAPPQACALTGSTGLIAGANVTGVNVVCAALTLEILDVTQTAPGQSPRVEFRVSKNGVPVNILSTPLFTLKATVSGPTTDYASSWQARIQGSGATGTLTALDAAAGRYAYVFPGAIPNPATGSYALALEGYFTDGAYPGVRFGAVSPVRFFPVTDAAPVARRTVVDDAKCNACHTTFTAHGGNLRGVQYCAFCHTANLSNDTNVPRFEGQPTITASAMDMKVLVHKIHRGKKLVQQPYLVGTFPAPSTTNPAGTQLDFGTVDYPADLRDCQACHLPGTNLFPLAPGLLPTTSRTWGSAEDPAADTDNYINTFDLQTTVHTPPVTAVCTSCHDAAYTAAHAAIMTTSAGAESCQTCHGTGSTYALERYHVSGR